MLLRSLFFCFRRAIWTGRRRLPTAELVFQSVTPPTVRKPLPLNFLANVDVLIRRCVRRCRPSTPSKMKARHYWRANKRAGAIQAPDRSFRLRTARNKRHGETLNFAIDDNFGTYRRSRLTLFIFAFQSLVGPFRSLLVGLVPEHRCLSRRSCCSLYLRVVR